MPENAYGEYRVRRRDKGAVTQQWDTYLETTLASVAHKMARWLKDHQRVDVELQGRRTYGKGRWETVTTLSASVPRARSWAR